MNCPACRAEMEKLNIRTTEVDQCRRCRGLWLDHTEVDELFSMDKIPERFLNQELYQNLPPLVAEGERACPRCDRFLKVIEVDGIKLDACSNCKGFFCDLGELKELALAAEMRFQRAQAQEDQD